MDFFSGGGGGGGGGSGQIVKIPCKKSNQNDNIASQHNCGTLYSNNFLRHQRLLQWELSLTIISTGLDRRYKKFSQLIFLIYLFNFFFGLASVTLCEGNKGTIHCLGGGKIKVHSASYGRDDGSTCPSSSIKTTNCHAGNSLSIVLNECNEKPSCELDSDNSVFGDPCKGTHKYLRVEYECIS